MRRVSLDEVLQAGDGRQAYMIIPVTGLTTIEELRIAQGFLIDDSGDPEEPPETEPEEKPRRKPPARKTVDAGKICALYKAGWSVKAIVDEIKCSEATVVNKLKDAGIYRGSDPARAKEDQA